MGGRQRETDEGLFRPGGLLECCTGQWRYYKEVAVGGEFFWGDLFVVAGLFATQGTGWRWLR